MLITDFDFNEEFNFIIPANSINLFKKFGGDCQFKLEKQKDKFARYELSNPNARLIGRFVDENYPDYKSVIPVNQNIEFEVYKDDLKSSINRVAIFIDGVNNLMHFKVGMNELTIFTDSDSGAGASETINIFSTNEIEFGLNYKLLLEILNLHTDELIFEMTEPNRPITIRSNNNIFSLIMPVRG
jgi:DNA polymerase-3 subunit beta